MLGLGLPPQRSLQVQLTPGMVEAYGMKKGTHLVCPPDLSALDPGKEAGSLRGSRWSKASR